MARSDVDDLVELEAAIAAGVDSRHRVTREMYLSLMDMSYFDLDRDAIVAVDPSGQLVAQGRAAASPGDETSVRAWLGGGVRPAFHGAGIGGRLLDWQIAAARRSLLAAERPEGEAAPRKRHMSARIAENDHAAVQLLELRGFRPSRFFVEMHRDLSMEVPTKLLPADLSLMTVTPAWWERIRVANNDAFREHWAFEPTSAERWNATLSTPAARDDLSVIAVQGEGESARVVGFVMVEVKTNLFASAGYSYAYISLVGVSEEQRGRGIAQALVSSALSGARAEGLERAVLDVDSANVTSALRLYERLGFVRAAQATMFDYLLPSQSCEEAH
jgi:mycothiol synthase